MGEMRESVKIIQQAVENLPGGPVNVGPDYRAILPEKGAVFSTIEGLISHFEIVMTNRGFTVPCEEVYSAVEAPNGELGFYIVGDGTPTGLSRPLPPALVYTLCRLPAPHPRAYT